MQMRCSKISELSTATPFRSNPGLCMKRTISLSRRVFETANFFSPHPNHDKVTRAFHRARFSVVAFAFGALLLVTSALGQVAFVVKQPNLMTTGLSPWAIALGDFKNNNKPGLAVANAAEGTVSIFQGVGDGTFGPKTDYPTGMLPAAVAVGDFGRALDTHVFTDLAVVNENNDTITILLNDGNGTGTFTPGTPITLATSSASNSIAVGDFDGDHNLDLAVTSSNNNTVSVFLGKGDGTFYAPYTFPTGTHPTGIVVADFNGDGNEDIAVANTGSNTITVLLGDGSGMSSGFTRADYTAYLGSAASPFPSALAVGDFNRDGKLDLAVAFSGVNFTTVLLNNGNGTFKAPVAYPTSVRSKGIAVADIDHNGKLALLVASANSNVVDVLPGNGDGTFRSLVPINTGLSNANAIVVGALSASQRLYVAIPSSNGLLAILVDDIVFADGFQ